MSKVYLLLKGLIPLIIIFFSAFYARIWFEKYIVSINTTQFENTSEIELYLEDDLVIDINEINTLLNYVKYSKEDIADYFDCSVGSQDIIIREGNCIGRAFLSLNIILLRYNSNCLPSVLHELIHFSLGNYKELWMTEGLAVYYSLLLKRDNNKLSKYVDSQDNYIYINDNCNQDLIVPLCRITRAYNKEKVRSFFNINDYSINYEDLGDNVFDFYALSGNFVEYIIDKIGEKHVRQFIVTNTRKSTLLKDYLNDNAINLDDLYVDWLDLNFSDS